MREKIKDEETEKREKEIKEGGRDCRNWKIR